MTDKELVEYIFDLLEHHIAIWIDRDGIYRPTSTKQELYKAIYDLHEMMRKEILENRKKEK